MLALRKKLRLDLAHGTRTGDTARVIILNGDQASLPDLEITKSISEELTENLDWTTKYNLKFNK